MDDTLPPSHSDKGRPLTVDDDGVSNNAGTVNGKDSSSNRIPINTTNLHPSATRQQGGSLNLKLSLKLSSTQKSPPSHPLSASGSALEVPKVKLKLKLPPSTSSLPPRSPKSVSRSATANDVDDIDVDIVVDEEDESTLNNSSTVSLDIADKPAQQASVNGENSTTAAPLVSRGRGRPPGKRRRKLYDLLDKTLSAFVKKDAYGFFLEPVNTSLVPDYLSIIKEPMDFGTIRAKITQRAYQTFQQFSNDVLLTLRNAKTYNAPRSIYHKSAHRILQFAVKTFERIEENTIIEDYVPVSSTLKLKSNVKGGSSTAAVGAKKKKSKGRTTSRFLLVDGSREPDSMMNDVVPHKLPQLEYPFNLASRSYNRIYYDAYADSADYGHSAFNYNDFGPFKALSAADSRLLSSPSIPAGDSVDKDMCTLLYGGGPGSDYVESLRLFRDEFRGVPRVADRISARLSSVTKGLFPVVDILDRPESATEWYPDSSHLKDEIEAARRYVVYLESMRAADSFNSEDLKALNQPISLPGDKSLIKLEEFKIESMDDAIELMREINRTIAAREERLRRGIPDDPLQCAMQIRSYLLQLSQFYVRSGAAAASRK